jgi:hypothetical protein
MCILLALYINKIYTFNGSRCLAKEYVNFNAQNTPYGGINKEIGHNYVDLQRW